jgi:hypothetical protein
MPHEATILRLTRRPPVTLSDIARKAGVTLSFVSACAHGRKQPTTRVKAAAEALLGRPAEELFDVCDS